MIHLLKFIHVIAALSLLGLTFYCLTTRIHTQKIALNVVTKNMLWFSALALLTGTFLTYPKHFTFHTPWIQAAYLLTTLFILTVFLLRFFKNALPKLPHWGWQLIISCLIILLILVIHDAVTHSTFIF